MLIGSFLGHGGVTYFFGVLNSQLVYLLNNRTYRLAYLLNRRALYVGKGSGQSFKVVFTGRRILGAIAKHDIGATNTQFRDCVVTSSGG